MMAEVLSDNTDELKNESKPENMNNVLSAFYRLYNFIWSCSKVIIND